MTRYGRSRTSRQAMWAAGAGIALAALAGQSHASAGPAADGLQTLTVAAGGMTPASWARSFLRSAGLPVTTCNLGAVTAWEGAEGGHWHNSAAFNPLNTSMSEPGSHPVNGDGVQAYTSWSQGLAATVATIRNGRYGAVLVALSRSGNAQGTADDVAASPWGTEPFRATC